MRRYLLPFGNLDGYFLSGLRYRYADAFMKGRYELTNVFEGLVQFLIADEFRQMVFGRILRTDTVNVSVDGDE